MERTPTDDPKAVKTARRYRLSELNFNLVPEDMPMPDLGGEAVNQVSANDIYRQAYRAIYNIWPSHDLGKNWQSAVSNAKAAQMNFKTFCLYIIAGWISTHGYTAFFPRNLTAESSVAKVELFRQACLKQYGASDGKSIGLLLNLEFYDIDDEMLLSEISFGRFITGSALKSSHNPCASFYSTEEIRLSPYWLAIEYTYHENILLPHLQAKIDGTEDEQKHRHLVCQAISALKRRSHLASTIFASRSRIMPKAVKSVLSFHGLTPDSFTNADKNVEDAFKFWRKLGWVIQHWEALKAVRNEGHRLWR